MSKHDTLSMELRSAFLNPQVPATVYLKAQFLHSDTIGSLFHVLQTLSSVKFKTLTVVSCNEVAACLYIHDEPNKVLCSPGEWVLVKRGLYKGDVGVILNSFKEWGGRRGSVVALVPRLSTADSVSQKHKKTSFSKQQPAPQLFIPTDCAQEMPTKTKTSHTFNQWMFENGLVLKTFHGSSLESTRVMPFLLFSLFCQSQHPSIHPTTMPIPDQWSFEAGERVLVFSPNSMTSIPGTIVGTNMAYRSSRGACIVDTIEGHQLFSSLYISKDIKPGDYVEICGGDDTGKAGFVVSRNEALLSIAPGRFGAEPVGVFVLFLRYCTLTEKNQDLWAHVNSVKLAISPNTPAFTEPWIDMEVQIKVGLYASFTGVVKHVRPDGKGSLRLAVYVPRIFCTLELDLFMVAELQYVFDLSLL